MPQPAATTPTRDRSQGPGRWRPGRRRRVIVAVVVPCLIGLAFIVLRASTFDSTTALLSIAPDNASFNFVHGELPDAYVFEGNGFDGMVFYTIARHPFDVHRTAANLDIPTYRLRRILYPAAAKALVPGGGIGLVYAFAALSLVGIGLGGWALSRFPHAPPWLPITMAVNAGTICALWTSTADALAAGLTLACFAAAFHRRFAAAVILLALAGLTREMSLVAVIALAAWPNLSRPRRVAHLMLPAVPVVAWSVYVAVALGDSLFAQPTGGTFTIPFVDWVRYPPPGGQLVLGVFLFGLMIAGAVVARHAYRPIALYLAVTALMYASSTQMIVNSWLGFGRVATVAFPLAVWAIVARARAPRAFLPTRAASESVPTLRPG